MKYEARLENGTVVSKSDKGVEFTVGDGKLNLHCNYSVIKFLFILSNPVAGTGRFNFALLYSRNRLSLPCLKQSSEDNEKGRESGISCEILL